MHDQLSALGRTTLSAKLRIIAIVPSMILLLIGCSSRPPTVRPINIDSGAAAKRAMEEYDLDKDGELASAELEKCAAIEKSLSFIDTDGSGSVSESELKQRLLQWKEQKMGVRSIKVAVSMNGQPLADADVEFQPESFMGDIAKPAFGFTDEYGVANMTHDAKDMPNGAEGARGVTNGFFRIKITHPKKQIPAEYNDETVLGKEIALDTVNSVMNVDL